MAKIVAGAWSRIERWARKHLPELLDGLAKGASPKQIATLERTLGQELPEELRESFALHDGQDKEGQPTGLVFGLPLLPLAEVARHWKTWSGLVAENDELRDGMKSLPAGAIQLDYANTGWIPLTFDWGGNHLGVDLAPGPKGTVGQVIVFGRDETTKCVAATSWGAFLTDLADQLEAGNFTITPDRQLAIKTPAVKHFHLAIAARYRKKASRPKSRPKSRPAAKPKPKTVSRNRK
jgi:cell wall assembly regulator SMI1